VNGLKHGNPSPLTVSSPEPRPRRAGRHLHTLAGLRNASWPLRPGGCAGPARPKASATSAGAATGPVPAAGRCASLPLHGPCAGHPAGSGSRSDEVRSGVTRQRSRARQGRTGRDLPARLIGYLPAPASPVARQQGSRDHDARSDAVRRAGCAICRGQPGKSWPRPCHVGAQPAARNARIPSRASGSRLVAITLMA